MFRLTVLLAGLLVLVMPAIAEKKPEPASVSALTFTVVKADNGGPVRNASIILHPVNARGQQQSGGFQLKTDPEGKASVGDIPYGKLRVQVIAQGFQTYGEDFDINQATQEIDIKLNRPQQQHTIYK
jgi:hypothetical protein